MRIRKLEERPFGNLRRDLTGQTLEDRLEERPDRSLVSWFRDLLLSEVGGGWRRLGAVG